jgi:hypothetical protein
MKRRLFQLVLFLLLGAIVNVAVAWGCLIHLAGNAPFPSTEIVSASDEWKGVVVWQNQWPQKEERSHSTGAVEATYFELESTDIEGVETWAELGCAKTSGWPCLALWGGLSWVDSSHRALDKPITVWAIDFNPILPLKPIWPGFAINTIFYAAVLWIVFAIPGGVKRLRRRAKGWCIHCGYDLRGQTTSVNGERRCPECGKAVHGAAAPFRRQPR